MTSLHFGLLLSAIGLTVAGCSSAPVTSPAAPPAVAAPAVQATAVEKTVSAAPSVPVDSGASQRVVTPSVTTVSLPPHLDPNNFISSQRSVFFDFDDFSVKSEFTTLLDRHGKYLASQPALRIKVEGNADARGSAEYNLALGQKRAEAVVRALQVYGARQSQMEAVSWGEERPRANGQGESVWSQNRRADLSYPRQ